MAWRVGMKVECVDNNGASQLTVGGKYTVREVLFGGDGLNVFETDCDWDRLGFRSERFRPLTDISIFEAIRDGKRRVADEPVDAETLREMERALADAGYMPADRYVGRNGK